jgi:pimeloyl-ACP methyl ester carboxylesterase
MAWVQVGSSDICYQEQGEGTPLVLLHGMSSCSEAWFQQFEALADRYRVIAYDSVNHGHSSNSPRDEPEPDRADELEGFLAALGIERPIVAGNSMGALTLIRWAARHPDTALALVPSGAGLAPPRGEQTEAERKAMADRLARMGRPLDPETIFLPFGDSLTDRMKEERPVLYDRYFRVRSTATRIEALRHPRPRASGFPSRDDLTDLVPKITSPMLVVVGSLDSAVPSAERLHHAVPGSRYHVIEGAPHNVYYEAADEYNRVVGAFLDEVVGSAAAAAAR